MKDTWRELVRLHLPALGLPPEQEEEVVEELARLLEDTAAEHGIDPDSPVGVGEWVRSQLRVEEVEAREIRSGKRARSGRLPLGPPPAGGGARSGLDRLLVECRYALRKLARDRGFTTAALLTLAVGIGLNTAVFSIINAVLFKPLPVTDSHELVNIYTTDTASSMVNQMPMSFPDFADLRDQSHGLAQLAGYTMVDLVLEMGERSELVTGELVTGNYFATLGVAAAVGRTITEIDDRPGGMSPVVVLSHSTWQRRFGADPGVVGREIRLNGQVYTIVGVAPAGFFGLTRGLSPVLWIPLRTGYGLGATSTIRMGTATAGLDRFADRNPLWLWAIGRLRPGVVVAGIESEAATFGARLRQEYPETNERRTYVVHATESVRVLPMIDIVLYGSSFVVMAIVALILLIASTNIANMVLARVTYRWREIATRLALGAGRGAVIRQLQLESLLLALGGGVLGLALALVSIRGVGALDLPIYLDLSLDLRVYLFTLTVAAASAFVFGLAPALAATRVNLSAVLRSDARGGTSSRGRRRLRGGLVIAQVAMSMLLLICAGLSLRSMLNAHSVDPGFDPAGVVVAEFAPNLQGYTPERVEEFYRVLGQRVGAVPGVRSVGFANNLPLTFALSSAGVAAEGRDTLPAEQWPQIGRAFVGPGYFETLRIPILRGRAFSDEDTADAAPVAIVNESLAALLWPGEEAVGKRLKVDDGSAGYYLVTGVARDGKYWTLGEQDRPYLYRSLTQHPVGERNLVARHDGNAQMALSSIRRAAEAIDERIAITGLESLSERISDSLLLPRASALLFGLAGLVGLLLAAFGLYGVIAYGVSRRTREIGIRMALGATPSSILRMAVREAVELTAVGAVLGISGAIAGTRVLSAVLYGVSATDPLTFVLVPLLLVLIALIAGLVPARRAALVDPVEALHWE